jgi:hypothetical protein
MQMYFPTNEVVINNLHAALLITFSLGLEDTRLHFSVRQKNLFFEPPENFSI